jgi:hypothetical protein
MLRSDRPFATRIHDDRASFPLYPRIIPVPREEAVPGGEVGTHS